MTLATVPADTMRATAVGITNRPDENVLETLAHHLRHHAHHVLRAAGRGVVAVVDEDDGPLRQRPRVRNLRGERRALVEEVRAPPPREIQHALEQGPALRGLSVAHDDRGAREMRDVRLREAAEHRRVEYNAALLGEFLF